MNGRTLAEVFGYLDPRSERRRWYAARSLHRQQQAHTLREIVYDRRCALCGTPLGGVDRLVFLAAPDPSSERNAPLPRHAEVARPRPALLVICELCRKLYRPSEYKKAYQDRQRNNNPLPLPE